MQGTQVPIPGQGTRPHVPQLKSSHAATKNPACLNVPQLRPGPPKTKRNRHTWGSQNVYPGQFLPPALQCSLKRPLATSPVPLSYDSAGPTAGVGHTSLLTEFAELHLRILASHRRLHRSLQEASPGRSPFSPDRLAWGLLLGDGSIHPTARYQAATACLVLVRLPQRGSSLRDQSLPTRLLVDAGRRAARTLNERGWARDGE